MAAHRLSTATTVTVLPAYAAERPIDVSHLIPRSQALSSRKEHVYNIPESNPWLSLRVKSSAKPTDRLPSFTENQTINGSVCLKLEKEDSIQSISLYVQGVSITTGDDAFLHHHTVLWNKSFGDPRAASSGTVLSDTKRYKLCGEHTWPFSMQLPPTVSIDSTEYSLPHSYSSAQCNVQYSIAVHVVRSKMRSDSHLSTIFLYSPNTRPNPASALRQAAYMAQTPLHGPDDDIEGWSTSRAITMSGTLSPKLPIQASFILSLANPLSYTRGTVIPLNLSVSSENGRQALDVLAAPGAIMVHLRRRVRYRTSKKRTADVSENDEVVALAGWWPRAQTDMESSRRQLEGEIRLPQDLMPSAALPRFTVSYHIDLLPSLHPQFTVKKKHDALLTESIEIATIHAPGPRPRVYAPPSYDNPEDKRLRKWQASTALPHGDNPMTLLPYNS